MPSYTVLISGSYEHTHLFKKCKGQEMVSYEEGKSGKPFKRLMFYVIKIFGTICDFECVCFAGVANREQNLRVMK